MNRRALPTEQLHRPRRDDTGRVLATRRAIAYLAGRNVDVVRRRTQPVACDVATRTELCDADQAVQTLALLPTRERVTA